MIFEWDEAKNRKNRSKHKLDFDAVRAFDWENACMADRTRRDEGEQRYAAVGLYAGKLHTVIFTKRGPYTRIISIRRSNKPEEKTYEAAQNQKI